MLNLNEHDHENYCIISFMNIKIKKTLLKAIPYGLYVVGISKKKSSHFFIGTWISQCSFDPPALSIAINKNSSAHKALKKSSVMSVNYCSKNDQSYLQTFLKKKTERPQSEIFYNDNGVGILKKAIAHLEILEWSIYSDKGDHSLIFAEIHAAHIHEKTESKTFDPITLQDTPWSYGG